MEKDQYIHTHGILNEHYLGQLNKTNEQRIRCFLHIMLLHSTTPRAKCPTIDQHQNSCTKYCEHMKTIFSDPSKSDSALIEIIRDDSFLSILGILNEYILPEIETFYLIFKTLTQSYTKSPQVSKYLNDHIEELLTKLMSNLHEIRENFIIIFVGKMIRKLLKCSRTIFRTILQLDIIDKLFTIAKTGNFILSRECLRLIFYIFESKKIDNEDVMWYILGHQIENSVLFVNNLVMSDVDSLGNDKYYYIKRETLRLLDLILSTDDFRDLNEKMLNDVKMLEATMKLLISKSNKIMINAMKIFGYFINDLEDRHCDIKHLLFDNKGNFEQFFVTHSDIREIEEKKHRVLYELERLANLLDK